MRTPSMRRTPWIGLGLLAAVAFVLRAATPQAVSWGGAPPTVRMNPGPADQLDRVTFDLLGQDADEGQASARRPGPPTDPRPGFSLTLDDPRRSAGDPEPTLPGSYRRLGAVWRFTPEKPIGPPPRRYHVWVDLSERQARSGRGEAPMEAWFTPPPRPANGDRRSP